jgi:hypothetical protein
MSSVDLQHFVNRIGLKNINSYCFKTQPISGKVDFVTNIDLKVDLPNKKPSLSTDSSASNNNNNNLSGNSAGNQNIHVRQMSIENEMSGEIHPLVQCLYDTIKHSNVNMKNVDLLLEVERTCLILGGIRVTFCKSGKDRTGMAVTLEQARQLGERFACGMSSTRLLKDANLMRIHGTRLMVAEKNIGKAVYSINILQAQFLPEVFRPPAQVCEDILKKDNS